MAELNRIKAYLQL